MRIVEKNGVSRKLENGFEFLTKLFILQLRIEYDWVIRSECRNRLEPCTVTFTILK